MSQEPKMYPLTGAQELIYLQQKYSLSKAVVDICIMLHIDCDMEQNLLLQSINLAMLRNQASSIRMHKVGKETMQYFSQKDREPVIVMDYSCETEEKLESDLNKWSQTPLKNNPVDCQLYSVRLIKKPNGFFGIYFCVNHLAFDAYALMSTASDLLKIYKALRDGLPIPKSKCDLLTIYEADFKYRTSKKYEKDIAYWRDVAYATEPMFTSVSGNQKRLCKGKRCGKHVDLLHSKGAHVNQKIPATLVSSIDNLAKKWNCSPQVFYMIGLRSYLSKVNYNETDVSILTILARRASLQQKRAGGTRATGIPFRMNFENSLSIYEATQTLKELQIKNFSHSDLTSPEIAKTPVNFEIPPMANYYSLSFTYQPYSIDTPEEFPIHLTHYSTGASSQLVYLTIMALDNSGELNCNYDYMCQVVDESVPYAMHEHLMKCLNAMIENQELTLNDLNQL